MYNAEHQKNHNQTDFNFIFILPKVNTDFIRRARCKQITAVIISVIYLADIKIQILLYRIVQLLYMKQNNHVADIGSEIIIANNKTNNIYNKGNIIYSPINKTPVTPQWRPYSVPTAFKKIAEHCGACCGNASNAVETLCNHLESHAAAFILSMLKTNAAAWCFHSVLDRRLWQHCGVFQSAVGALWARRVHAVKMPCKFCIWSRGLQCILIIKQIIIITLKYIKYLL